MEKVGQTLTSNKRVKGVEAKREEVKGKAGEEKRMFGNRKEGCHKVNKLKKYIS